jgi:hypothetical protein
VIRKHVYFLKFFLAIKARVLCAHCALRQSMSIVVAEVVKVLLETMQNLLVDGVLLSLLKFAYALMINVQIFFCYLV